MKFEMPTTREGKIAMHSAALLQVQAALINISRDQGSLQQRIGQKSTLGFDTGADQKILRNLRRQELCLADQEIRLQERIASLQTGS